MYKLDSYPHIFLSIFAAKSCCGSKCFIHILQSDLRTQTQVGFLWMIHQKILLITTAIRKNSPLRMSRVYLTWVGILGSSYVNLFLTRQVLATEMPGLHSWVSRNYLKIWISHLLSNLSNSIQKKAGPHQNSFVCSSDWSVYKLSPKWSHNQYGVAFVQ